jgi:hypothetical protein
VVDDLNEVVRSKGRQKMELLEQIKEFKKGIYALQWENRRCVAFAVCNFGCMCGRGRTGCIERSKNWSAHRLNHHLPLTEPPPPLHPPPKSTEMEAEDAAALARELQLLHVTKDFQQLVKAGPGAKTSASGGWLTRCWPTACTLQPPDKPI